MNTKWIHTTMIFEKEGQKDLVVEGDHKEDEVDKGGLDFMLQATMAGWKLKEKKDMK